MHNAKPEFLPDHAVGDPEGPGRTIDLGFGQVARHGATLLASLAGTLAIANLWLLPLTEQTLLTAGRGVVLLLLAIGLMGTARLSLFLTLIVALTGLDLATPNADGTVLIAILEVCLAGSAALALLSPRIRSVS